MILGGYLRLDFLVHPDLVPWPDGPLSEQSAARNKSFRSVGCRYFRVELSNMAVGQSMSMRLIARRPADTLWSSVVVERRSLTQDFRWCQFLFFLFFFK